MGGGGGREKGIGRERRRGRISACSGHLSQDTQKQISFLQATKTTGGKEGPGTWLTSVGKCAVESISRKVGD